MQTKVLLAIMLLLMISPTQGQACYFDSDIMLLIDLSSSMGGSLGESKAAGQEFVNLVESPTIQLGVASFSNTGEINQPLTFDTEQVQTTIDNLVTGSYTNLGDGIRIAQSAFTNPARKRVIILLSDGLPNAYHDGNEEIQHCPEDNACEEAADFAKSQANAAKSTGTVIYAIGLGDDFIAGAEGEDLLKNHIATDAEKFFFAPQPEDLQNIYTEIAKLSCRVRIAEIGFPKTIFKPQDPAVTNPISVILSSDATASVPMTVTLRMSAWTENKVKKFEWLFQDIELNAPIYTWNEPDLAKFLRENEQNPPWNDGVHELVVEVLVEENRVDQRTIFFNTAIERTIQVDEIPPVFLTMVFLIVLVTLSSARTPKTHK